MAIDYLLTSANVPALVVSGALHDPSLGLPATFFSQQPGVSATLSAGLRENAVRAENIARYGGGAYSIGEGLDLVAGTGLLCNITPGAVILDGVVVKPADGSGNAKTGLALTNGARNFIWATATDIVALTGLSPPAGPAACLGSFLTAAGAISGNPDYSGRYEHRGPGLWRRTADAGVPADTPSARVMFVATTAGGTYLWTGAAWVQFGTAGIVGGYDNALTGTVTTTDATPTIVLSETFTADGTYAVTLHVAGKQQGGSGEGVGYLLQLTVTREGSALAIVAQNTLTTHESAGLTGCAVAVTTGGSVDVDVTATGIAATTIKWKARMLVVSVLD